MSIQTPVADSAGRLVWADELATEGRRPDELQCLACGGRLVLRAGEVNQPHFAHFEADACTAPETALHRTTCRILTDSLLDASDTGRRFPISVSCQRCAATREGNLARQRLTVVEDQVLADGIRPDLLARVGERALYVVEVVVTHAPEAEALRVYEERELPVLIVRPSWEMLPQLTTGFAAESQAARRGQPGSWEIASPCQFPRHTDSGPHVCDTCGEAAKHLTAEVSTVACWANSCNNDVRVLDIYDHTPPTPQFVAASCPDLPDPSPVADRLGVKLEWRSSKQARTAYLMHVCGSCKASQGDNFLYEPGEAQPDLSSPVLHLRACPNGHMSIVDERDWSERTEVRRGYGTRPAHVVGLIGEPPGLFSQGAAGQVQVEQVGMHNVRDVARRMTGF